MTTAVLAAVARDAGGAFNLEQLVLDDPEDDEVLVRIAGVGLCHTDLAARDQVIPIPLPAVFGHEGAGTVERVGRNVLDLAPGDSVILSFMSCGLCPPCADGQPAYCGHFVPLNFGGGRTGDGTALHNGEEAISSHFFSQSSFANYALANRRNVVKASSDLPLALLGPLGGGIQTGAGAILHSLDCKAGQTVAIFGAGPVGISAVMAAAARGCSTIIVIEPVAARRKMALGLGATDALDPAAGDVLSAIRSICPGGIDASLDVTGIPAVIETAIASLRKRGTCALIGVPEVAGQTFSVRTGLMVQNGTTLVGVMEGDSDPQVFIPQLLEMQAAGDFPFERMITTYSFADINRAVADQKAGFVLKAVLIPD